MPSIPLFPGEPIGYDAYGLPVISRMVGFSTQVDKVTPLAHFKLQQFQNYHPSDPAVARAVNDFRNNSSAIMGDFFSTHPITAMAAQYDPSFFNFVFSLNIERVVGTPVATHIQIPIGQIMAQYQMSAVGAQQQLSNDVAVVEGYNAEVSKLNEQVGQVLRDSTGEDFGTDRERWMVWWVNQMGYSYTTPPETPRPTVVENVPLAYLPQPVPVTSSMSKGNPTTFVTVTPQSMVSCFGAGTMVRTLAGSHPIETLRVGDRVLTQDIKTGALGYHPVTVIHHNPPSPTFLVKVGGDTIVSSPFHRFWIVGKGWIMARDLKGGENLRLLDGPAKIASVESGPVQPVFNLDVAEDHDFFAGAAAALVHDNTLPDLRQTPFDAEPSLAALAPYGK
jgi:hypothetical protein